MVSNLLNTFARVGMVAILARIYAREEFGVWVVITSTTAILATSDFGIGNALRNKLAALATRGESGNNEAREYFLSAFYFFLIAALVLSVGLLIFRRFIPFQLLFKTSDVALQRVGADILITVQIIFLVGIPLGIGPVMFFAYQESTWNAMFTLANGLIGTAMVCGLALMGKSIASTAIWYFLTGLLVTTVGTAGFLRRRRWNPLRVTVRLILPRVWSLISVSLRFAFLQVSTVFIVNMSTIAASATIGSGTAAEYNLVQKLFVVVITLFHSFLNPLWAGYNDASNRGDWAWCRRTFNKTIFITITLFSASVIVFTIWGNWFLKLFAGPAYISFPLLFVLVGVWSMNFTLWSVSSTFLFALGRINFMCILLALLAVVGISLQGSLGVRYGIIGIAIVPAVLFLIAAIAAIVQGYGILRAGMRVNA